MRPAPTLWFRVRVRPLRLEEERALVFTSFSRIGESWE